MISDMTVKLIRWEQALRDDLIKICNSVDRSYLSDRMPYPYTDADADWWLSMVSEHDGRDGLFRAIEADGVMAGSISLEQKDDVWCRDADIGYMLLTEFWSKGIATEAVRLICEEGFEKLDIARITGTVYLANTASQHVLVKNGFVREGLMRDAAFRNGKMHDVLIYGLTKKR